MTTGPPPERDPFRPLDSLAALWSATPLTAGPATVYRTLFETARRYLVGRSFTVRTNAGDLRLTLTGLDARLDPLALSVGQLDDVRIVAENLRFRDHRIARATVLARNVHVRPATVPELVAAPVELTITLDAETVTDLLRRRVPWLAAEVDAHATAGLRWQRRPDLGWVEVDVDADGMTLWCRPRAVHVRGRRWPVPARTPAYPVRLRSLPPQLRLTGVETEPGVVRLHGVLSTWRKSVPTRRLNELLRQIRSAAGLLDLSRWAR